MAKSFYWHDYETWGTNPACDRPVQFAGQRTDWDLNPVGEPLVIYACPANDMLPQPAACLITGITPQFATANGLQESEFIARIHQELAYPDTCSTGYNSLRFDDEVTRYTLFRNFFNPYDREWRNGNSRWDLIDVMRLAYALRPDGLEWPQQGGRASFRLTDLTAANNIAHIGAHEALSDVHASINLARLLKTHQPRLFDFALGLRNKQRVKELLGLPNPQPILHVSSKYSAELGCIAPVLALAPHPIDRNGILVIDLRSDPDLLLDLDVEAIKYRLFTRREAQPDPMERIPIKTVHINRVPMLAPLNTLNSRAIERWDINLAQIQANAARLRTTPGLIAKLQQIFAPLTSLPKDPEQDLYGALLNNDDQRWCEMVRNTNPQELKHLNPNFRDARLPTLLFRYRARNWPTTLTPEEFQQWNQYRLCRLTDPNGGGSITVDKYRAELADLRVKHSTNHKALEIIKALAEWEQQLAY